MRSTDTNAHNQTRMMDDLKTLSCPSCGANLKVNADAKQLICEYCGGIHTFSDSTSRIPADGPSCPIDSHKDVILKVSAITKSQVFTAPENFQSENPITYKSKLALQLQYPPKPIFPYAIFRTRIGLMFGIIALALVFACVGGSLISFPSVMIDMPVFIILLVLGLFLSIPVTNRVIAPALSRAESEYQDRQKKWEIARKKWENSYYCQRHDIAFIEGSDRVIPLAEYQHFMLRE